MLVFIIKLLAFTFLVTVPNGPIGFLVLREMILKRQAWAWVAFGATLSDIFYALVVMLGLLKIQHVLLAHIGLLQAIAALLLITIGSVGLYKLKTIQLTDASIQAKEMSSLEAMMVGFFGCVVNPTLIFSFSGTMTALGIIKTTFITKHNFLILIPIIFAGSAITWLLVYVFVHRIRKLSGVSPRMIALVSNAILLGFGLLLLAASIWYGVRHGFITLI